MENPKKQEKNPEKKIKINEEGAFQFQIESVICFKVEESSAQEVIDNIKKEKEKLRVYEIKIEEKRQKLVGLSNQMKEESQNLLKKRKDLEIFEEKMLKKFEGSNNVEQTDKNELYSYFKELYGKLEKERAQFKKKKRNLKNIKRELKLLLKKN